MRLKLGVKVELIIALLESCRIIIVFDTNKLFTFIWFFTTIKISVEDTILCIYFFNKTLVSVAEKNI